jgi:hypothetical protein
MQFGLEEKDVTVRRSSVASLAFVAAWLLLSCSGLAIAQDQTTGTMNGFEIPPPPDWEIMTQASLDIVSRTPQTNPLGPKGRKPTYGLYPRSGVDESGLPRILIFVDHTGRFSDSDISSALLEFQAAMDKAYRQAGITNITLPVFSYYNTNRLLIVRYPRSQLGNKAVAGLVGTYYTDFGMVSIVASCTVEDFAVYEPTFDRIIRSLNSARSTTGADPGKARRVDSIFWEKWFPKLAAVLIFALWGAYKAIRPVLIRRAVRKELRKKPADPETPVTCSCKECGSPITYPFKLDGTLVECPTCHKEIKVDL